MKNYIPKVGDKIVDSGREVEVMFVNPCPTKTFHKCHYPDVECSGYTFHTRKDKFGYTYERGLWHGSCAGKVTKVLSSALPLDVADRPFNLLDEE